MKEQFNDDINALTGTRSSNSGKPASIDEKAPTEAFERSWDWTFEVRELGPNETAECKVTMGADDLATLTVDGEEKLNIGPRGEYGGGNYEPQDTSFSIEPGIHQAHVDYSNISIPNPDNNIAKFTFDLTVDVTAHGAQSGFFSLCERERLLRRPARNCPDPENKHGLADQLRFLPGDGRSALRPLGNRGLQLFFQTMDSRRPAIPAPDDQPRAAPSRRRAGG